MRQPRGPGTESISAGTAAIAKNLKNFVQIRL